jgi:hypothetical protein
MGDYICIDLKSYFNHKAIEGGNNSLYHKNPEHFGLGPQHLYFKEIPYSDSENELQIESIPFQFSDQSTDMGFDNIRCEEQNIYIQIKESNIKKVHILGCSVFDHFKDEMIVTFSNGQSEQAGISFFGWSRVSSIESKHQFIFDREFLSDNRVAVLDCLNTNEQKVGYTYCYSTLKNMCSKPNSIKLPDNNFMHIFAMTLETE